MPVDGFAHFLGCLNFSEDLRVLSQHTRVVHHLRQAQYPIILQEFFDVRGREEGSSRFQGGGWNAGRSHEEIVQGQIFTGIDESLDPWQAKDVGNLMGIENDRRGPMGQGQTRIFGGG